MTATLEAANEALRSAVQSRLDATPADDPKMQGYVTNPMPVRNTAEDLQQNAPPLAGCQPARECAARVLADAWRSESCCDGGKRHPDGDAYAEWVPPAYARQTGDGVMGERPIGSVEWLDAVEQLRELHFEKTAQYGDTDPFANVTASAKCGVEPWRRALCDLSDCVVRMQRYANGQPVDYENALMDAANWALICLVKLREAKA